ncbi:phosphopantetheine-binding protein [Sphaerisporangium sp. TRM90804]|uniref:acyl carrier protein n=1 Tax=Sphaerisporangium sp. TRM90804 TaxID=3031113 RepID=UPI002446AE09|nr:phosphopantetheine-binding protein [Sphaerisporangium sp. TRM90804]MDH2430864.1 phosphopantetheine-binding protein [Sphaerisporangium sp. TRM90804]
MSENLIHLTDDAVSDHPWDAGFESILRRFLPFLGAGEALAADAPLRDLGLDSIGTVELLAALEDAYDLRFQDDALEMGNFSTPGVLWKTLSSITDDTV